MILETVAVICLVIIFDLAAFWKVGNWRRQFAGKDIDFTYLGTIFPRIILTIASGFCIVIAKYNPDFDVVLFILALVLFGTSHGVLYVKAYRSR
ncbi:hypothetical protein [Sphingobium scionense]|uniref:Uncharacterized protein n=1 Tax=Sphingobium scionense TaxID=1404341 RepID=A0A7W6LQ97_9SPHN|nr:hypothetical protein [Sphingobium scionense]MBB4148371.1 hypothetical protein [Sphingobium scionense]